MMNEPNHETQDARWLGDASGKAPPDAITGALDAAYQAGPDGETAENALARVRSALEKRAYNQVFYDVIPDTPIGVVYLAVGPRGLVAVDMNIPEEDFQMAVFHSTHIHPERDPGKTRLARSQLEEYLNGERESFDLPLDLEAQTPFQRQVLLTTIRVPRGKVASYGEIARRIGKPGASRAVGQALGQNPIPIVIPCHRVIAADGSLGGYSGGGGLETKARLLAMEGAIST